MEATELEDQIDSICETFAGLRMSTEDSEVTLSQSRTLETVKGLRAEYRQTMMKLMKIYATEEPYLWRRAWQQKEKILSMFEHFICLLSTRSSNHADTSSVASTITEDNRHGRTDDLRSVKSRSIVDDIFGQNILDWSPILEPTPVKVATGFISKVSHFNNENTPREPISAQPFIPPPSFQHDLNSYFILDAPSCFQASNREHVDFDPPSCVKIESNFVQFPENDQEVLNSVNYSSHAHDSNRLPTVNADPCPVNSPKYNNQPRLRSLSSHHEYSSHG